MSRLSKYGSLLLLALSLSSGDVFSQSRTKDKKQADSAAAMAVEVKELEKMRVELSDRLKKLKLSCRQDSINILNMRTRKRDADYQSSILKSGIAELEAIKDKTKDQKKLLKDLRQGHNDLQARFAELEAQLAEIEINYRSNMAIVAETDLLLADLSRKIRELRSNR